jgi:hypothetical protein
MYTLMGWSYQDNDPIHYLKYLPFLCGEITDPVILLFWNMSYIIVNYSHPIHTIEHQNFFPEALSGIKWGEQKEDLRV